MSIESAKAYVERITTDEEFRNKITACKDAKERMELAKSAGFDFTSEEIKQVGTELSEEELNALAGGLTIGSIYVCITNDKQGIAGPKGGALAGAINYVPPRRGECGWKDATTKTGSFGV